MHSIDSDEEDAYTESKKVEKLKDDDIEGKKNKSWPIINFKYLSWSQS